MGRSFECWPDWRGQVAVVVASGPTAAEVPLEKARGRARLIVVNESWRLAPWADILYACDAKWWQHCWPDGFAGMKVAYELPIGRYGITSVDVRRDCHRIEMAPGILGDGGSSGFQALNLAVQLGARRVILVGYDMRADFAVHWHGRYENLTNPGLRQFSIWKSAMDGVARELEVLGVEVLNASPISALMAYRKVGFEEALT